MCIVPLQIDSVMKDSPASKLGLVKGDKILAINNKKVDLFQRISDRIGQSRGCALRALA